jgi:hypothetical protein
MAKAKETVKVLEPTKKATSIGRGLIKTSSMNKHKRRSYKKYRGQG